MGAVCSISDFCEEADMFSWAGAGFSESECYKVKCSMRAHANKQREAGLKKLRFWGKVLGTDQDYYIVEASPHLDPPGGPIETAEDDPDVMETEGVNTFTYFVTTDLCSDWTQLPDLKPSEIRVARQIKKLMTGDLKSEVVSHPFFPGNEAQLLRAQIAQITSDTILCIKGFLKREDPEDLASAVVGDEEFTAPSPSELTKMQNWMHMQPHILGHGRTTHKALEDPPEEPEELEKFKKEKEMQEADPAKDTLRLITADGLDWLVKQAGDTALYKNPFKNLAEDAPPGSRLPPRSYAVTYVRSLTWPGAVTVSRGGQFANLYVGYGCKSGQPDFFMRAPPDVQDEPDEADEQDEPQGEVEAPPPKEDE